MSRKYGDREGQGSGTPATSEGFAAPGKHTRTEGFEGTGRAEGSGTGELAGPPAQALPASPADAAIPATTGSTKVTHETDQKAPGGAANTRTTVAVGERVYFTAETAGDKAKWSASAGQGKGAREQWDWVAPATPDTVTVTFDPGDGGTATTVKMTVIGPNGINYSDKVEDTIRGAGAGMTNKLTFLPLSVCFWGTQWRETDVDATNVTGWFTHLSAARLKHRAAPPRNIGDDNSGPKDHASFTASPPFKEAGSFTWVIPQQYSVRGANNWQEITTPFTQLTTIEADGTLTVTKNGESVTRSPG
jgi:hypothetical protein